VTANAIVEITTQYLATDPPRDFFTNHLSFQTDAAAPADADYQALANSVKNSWFNPGTGKLNWQSNGGYVNAYNRADPKPRPERGHAVYTPGTWATVVPGPRQIALVASFYSARNLKRQRGRIYIPTNSGFGYGQRPDSASMSQAVGLIKAIAAGAAALTPVWILSVWSSIDNQNRAVTNVWCNDVWDTQRRRSPKETTRTLGTVP
jgi:hypothetical protein